MTMKGRPEALRGPVRADLRLAYVPPSEDSQMAIGGSTALMEQ